MVMRDLTVKSGRVWDSEALYTVLGPSVKHISYTELRTVQEVVTAVYSIGVVSSTLRTQ